MRKVLVASFVPLVVLATMLIGSASAAVGQCPAGWTTKVEAQTSGELDDVVLEAGTVFCVKAGTQNTGMLTADGTTTLCEYLIEAGIVTRSGDCKNVSHYVVYPSPPPSETPSASASLSP